jgi:hypothetical protein
LQHLLRNTGAKILAACLVQLHCPGSAASTAYQKVAVAMARNKAVTFTAQQSKIPQGKEDFQKMKILLVPCKRRGAIARHAAASACKVTLQQAVAKCLIFEPSIPKHMSGLHSLLRNLAHRN